LIWFKNYLSGRRQFVFVNNEPKFFPEYDNEVSSANSLAKLPKLSVMSLIYNKNNKRSSTDPCGTPALTRPESDSSLFTNTNCLLPKTWLVDFNPKKTKALIISNNTNIPELNIRFNDESVELVDNHKHLGVTS
jgi:hypothetical protein